MIRKLIAIMVEEAKKTVREYFRPLTQRWFWYYVFPFILALSIYMALRGSR